MVDGQKWRAICCRYRFTGNLTDDEYIHIRQAKAEGSNIKASIGNRLRCPTVSPRPREKQMTKIAGRNRLIMRTNCIFSDFPFSLFFGLSVWLLFSVISLLLIRSQWQEMTSSAFISAPYFSFAPSTVTIMHVCPAKLDYESQIGLSDHHPKSRRKSTDLPEREHRWVLVDDDET